jgi:hypothetical protein
MKCERGVLCEQGAVKKSSFFPQHSMIKFSALDVLPHKVVAASSDRTPESALPSPSLLDRPASYRGRILRRSRVLVS